VDYAALPVLTPLPAYGQGVKCNVSGPITNRLGGGPISDVKGNCGQPTTLTTCQQFMAAGLPCIPAVASFTAQTPVTVTPPAFAPGDWGTTAAQISANFGPSQYTNFASNSNINYQIANMDMFSMSRLSTELVRTGDGYLPYVLEEAALHLTATNLAYMRSAFGPIIDSNVSAYAPPSVAAQYFALPLQAPLPDSSYAAASGQPVYVPMSDMSNYDLYLDVYTAATTATSNRAAIHNMLAYQAKFGLGNALTVLGKAFGGAATVYAIGKAVDPDLDEQLRQLAWDMANNELAMAGQPTATPQPELEGPPSPSPPPTPDLEGPPTPDTDYVPTCTDGECASPT
jgi:hypothetical protein